MTEAAPSQPPEAIATLWLAQAYVYGCFLREGRLWSLLASESLWGLGEVAALLFWGPRAEAECLAF